MRVHPPKLICSTGVSSFQTFKRAFCMQSELKSNRSVLNVNNGGPWNPKLALKENSLWIKFEAQDFASEVLDKHAFKIWRKKKSEFFYHSSTRRSRERHSTTSRVFPYTSFVFYRFMCALQQNRPQSRLLYSVILVRKESGNNDIF